MFFFSSNVTCLNLEGEKSMYIFIDQAVKLLHGGGLLPTNKGSSYAILVGGGKEYVHLHRPSSQIVAWRGSLVPQARGSHTPIWCLA